MAPNSAFTKDEDVLCFHQELLYEAKVLNLKPDESAEDKKNAYQYFVHYRGWKRTWDQWVPQDRLRKKNEDNQELAKALAKEMLDLRQAQKGGSKLGAQKKKGEPSVADSEERGAVAGKKRGRDLDTEKSAQSQRRALRREMENEEAYTSRPAIRIILPDSLKSILVDDWENVTKNLQLVRVPAKNTSANKILEDYYQQELAKRQQLGTSADILEESIHGMKVYFNKALGRVLLYRYERGQYLDILNRINAPGDELEGRDIGDIYGGEHLLRLFSSLPELIAQTNMDHQSASRLREEINSLTNWLGKQQNINKYFTEPYEDQDSEYRERFRFELKHLTPDQIDREFQKESAKRESEAAKAVKAALAAKAKTELKAEEAT
ncbi:MRG-domain-containing protein [Microthyrium microscopicum]|uniref:Chromatin modification-related protein EAF3 n=1 Tax=Microthyrium microscopicum TaxID=703497 RepID=A0A6A6U5F5_9PEZI|nr:MRG-domain-containing protein [Microthyrium microscopicum]